MTINQAIEYAEYGDRNCGPITHDALAVLARAVRQRNGLLAALESLIELDDAFQDGDTNYENAYLCFYKGEYETWAKARAAVTNAKEDSK